jgi:hypothetical protein
MAVLGWTLGASHARRIPLLAGRFLHHRPSKLGWQGQLHDRWQDNRAVNVQLTAVLGGQRRCLADIRTRWSGGFSGRIVKLPKLTVRVRA